VTHIIIHALGIVLMLTGAVFWSAALIWIGLAIFANSPAGRRALAAQDHFDRTDYDARPRGPDQ